MRTPAWLGLLFTVLIACDDGGAGRQGGRDGGGFTDDPTPFESRLDGRIAEYRALCAALGLSSANIHAQACVLAQGTESVRDDAIDRAIDKMDRREDTADFGLAGLVRILAKYADRPGLSRAQHDRIVESARNFKYWIDEPGADGMCYWSENHYMLFNSAAFVMGRLFPQTTFTNSGVTGTELRAKARRNILSWLNTRLRWGFSEFHSDVYYNEDVPALVNVVDFGDDHEVQTKATMALDILLYDMALNDHEGVFGTAHGRSYMKDKKSLANEDTRAIMWLAFGKGEAAGDEGNMGAVALADSDVYRLPAVIESVGSARPRGLETLERLSIRVADGPGYGIGYDDPNDGVLWWTMGAYVMPETIDLTLEMASAWNLFEDPSSFFYPFQAVAPLAGTGILPAVARAAYPLVAGSALEQVNTYAYRTPEVMLAGAQAWKPATLGMQTHAWQATLGPDALLFTTQPGPTKGDDMAGPWTGGWHPRVAIHRTAAIILYGTAEYGSEIVGKLAGALTPGYTHAYFPRGSFDEFVSSGSWTFGREGNGFVGLYSLNPTVWEKQGEWAGKELRAEGTDNIWICEVGDTTQYESFDEFVRMVSAARIETGDENRVLYQSPGQGPMEFSWTGPLVVRGREIAIGDYGRFDSPYSRKEFDGPDPYVIERGGRRLTLDPRTLTRIVED